MNSSREFDVVILGASGFTGRYVVAEALKFLSTPSSPLKTLALAGRNPAKISQALAWASASQTHPPVIPIIAADVSSQSSLTDLAKRAKVILNCVGPFCIYGAPVVSACVEAGTDYLDLSGESEFMDTMAADHHERAAKAGSLVVSACGFDTVAAELGFAFNSRQWVGPAAAPNSVEAYMVQESEKRIVFATLETEVVMMENAAMSKPQRTARYRPSPPIPPQIPGPAPEARVVERQKSLGLWAVQRPAADATVVRRTLETIAENPEGLPGVEESDGQVKKRREYWASVKPAHFVVKLGFKSPLELIRLMLMGLFLWLLGMSSVGRSLLLKFPGFFSLGWVRPTGPTDEEVKSATFKMWFVGRGYGDAGKGGGAPDTEIVTRVSGPEAGYTTTAIIIVQCALTVLSQRRNLPRGGVFTPGIVFGPTDLQARLEANGLSFELVSNRSLADP